MIGLQNRKGRWLLSVMAMLYGIGFVVWRVLVASPLFARWWPLQVGEIFAVWSLIPLPLFLIAGLIWRSRWVWVGVLIPLLWFGTEYGSLFLPSSIDVAPAVVQAGTHDATLRLMTLNTWKKDDREGDFAVAVAELQPQLIALQEVSSRFRLDLKELETGWPYQVHGVTGGRGRVALLSKVPILSYHSDGEWLGCHCMQVVVAWQGQAIRVIVVHIWSPSYEIETDGAIPLVRGFNAAHQVIAYDALLKQAQSSSEPVIILGDFNTTERQSGYHRLYVAGFKDAHAEVGWGLGHTYPAPFRVNGWLTISLIRIDHLFYDAAWQASRVWTTPLMGSDHQALIADLEFMVQE